MRVIAKIIQTIQNSTRNFLQHASWIEKLLLIAVILLIIRSLIPMLMTGFPTTHDGEGQVARIANYAVALRQGQFPPRFAPTFWNGYGYPVFNFYYPLLNILGAPLVLVGIHPEIALKFWVSISWLMLWIGVGLFAWQLTKQRSAALLAVVLFALSPYFYTVVYVRGAYGELLAITAFTWLLYVLERQTQHSEHSQSVSPSVVISGALLLLAHNIYASVLFPFAGLYALLRRKSTTPTTTFAEFTLSFGLAAFFWIPMLLEKKYIVLDDQVVNFFQDHFLQFSQLTNSTVSFGVSTSGAGDTMSLGIGWASIGVGIAAILYLFQTKPWNWNAASTQTRKIILPFVVVIGCVGLVLPASLFIWKTIFILPYFQFPWRFLGPLTLSVALLGSLVWASNKKVLQAILAVGILVHALYLPTWYWPQFSHFAPEYFFNYFQTSTVYDEAKAKTFTVEPGTLSPSSPAISGSGTIENLKWRGTYRTYIIKASDVVTITEPTMYFPGWKVRANGSEVALITQETSPSVAREYKGQVAYTLPAGEWQIHSQMTQQTPPRLVGNTITLLSVGLTGWLVYTLLVKALQKSHSKKK